MGCALSGI